jgi:hypothetical protein
VSDALSIEARALTLERFARKQKSLIGAYWNHFSAGVFRPASRADLSSHVGGRISA